MEKRNDDRPERPLNERRTFYNSENRPVSREERGGEHNETVRAEDDPMRSRRAHT